LSLAQRAQRLLGFKPIGCNRDRVNFKFGLIQTRAANTLFMLPTSKAVSRPGCALTALRCAGGHGHDH